MAILLIFFFALSLAACSDPGATTAKLALPADTAVFPSDRHTVPDAATRTGRRLSLAAFQGDALFRKFDGVREDLESLDGFGTTSPLYIRFADRPRLARLPSPEWSAAATSPIRLIALETGAAQRFRWHYESSNKTLFVTPLEPLAPKSRFALVAAGLEAHGGGRYEERSFVDPLPVALPDADPPGLQVRAVFTTQSIHEGLVAAVDDAALAHGAGEFPAPLDDCAGLSHVGYLGSGSVTTTDHRTEGGRFPTTFDDASPRRNGRAASIPYLFMLPKKAERAPVILLQHGLMSYKEQAMRCASANEYAKHGFAAITIDAVGHGERGLRGGDATIVDNFHMIFGLVGDGERYRAEFRFARDSLRQTALDHVAVVKLVQRMAQSLDVTGPTGPDGVPDVSDDVFYYGASMGGIIGSMTFAVTADLQAAALNVPGGRLHNIALETDLNVYDLFLRPALSGGELPQGEVRRLFVFYQTMVERAEPLNYARHWWRSPLPGRKARSVIIQETIDDNTVPNVATRELTLAGGLPLLTPALEPPPGMPTVAVPASGLAENLAPGVAGGMAQFDFVFNRGKRARADHATMGAAEPVTQATRLFRSVLDGTPRVYPSYVDEARP